MKKMFLMGRSEAGKTTLTQVLKGEALRYEKTQYTRRDGNTIDSPGEYSEAKQFSVGLACFSFESDVIALVQAADEPFDLFGCGLHCAVLRPMIGIITKIDSPHANVPMIREWMANAGCDRIFEINNLTGEGVDGLIEYLEEDLPPLTMEQAEYRQSLGIAEWEALPEGGPYPKSV